MLTGVVVLGPAGWAGTIRLELLHGRATSSSDLPCGGPLGVVRGGQAAADEVGAQGDHEPVAPAELVRELADDQGADHLAQHEVTGWRHVAGPSRPA